MEGGARRVRLVYAVAICWALLMATLSAFACALLYGSMPPAANDDIRFRHVGDVPAMTHSQYVEMMRSGRVDIGSDTVFKSDFTNDELHELGAAG